MASQVQSLLEQLPFLTDIETYDVVSPGGGNQGSIYWTWNGHKYAGGTVSYSLDSTVYRVTVAYPTLFTFQDVIDAYGEPSHVYAWANPSTDGMYNVYGLDVVYLRQGMALGLREGNVHRPDDFGPEWSNFYLYFFEPTLEGFAVAWGNPLAAKELTPWRGMLGFDAYCRGARCAPAPF